MRDEIKVTDLALTTSVLAPDHWQRPSKLQPLVCSLLIRTSVQAEASTDSLLDNSLNYGTVTKAVEGHVALLEQRKSEFGTEGIPLEVLADQLAKVVLFKASAPNVLLELRRPRAHLRAESVGVEVFRSRIDYALSPTFSSSPSTTSKPSPDHFSLRTDTPSLLSDKLFVRALRRHIIIGLNACEREDEQEVIVDLDFGCDIMNTRLSNGGRACWAGWKGAVKQVEEVCRFVSFFSFLPVRKLSNLCPQHLSSSSPLTIEHICTSLARLIVTPSPASTSSSTWNVPSTTVRVSKPVALMFAKYPGVAVTRTRADFFPSTLPAFCSFSSAASLGGEKHIAYLGIGTNLGERAGNLNEAVKTLEELGKGAVKLVDTSFLYESEAMYHEEQGKFLNAVLKVETSLAPVPLLHLFKSVETTLGRDFTTFRNGPRVIDLDLLLYEDTVFDSREGAGAKSEKEDERWLRVPHAGIAEREFVLRPLSDLAPDLKHPTLAKTPSELLSNILSTSRSSVHRVFPLSPSLVAPFSRPSAPSPSGTLVMTILNATPDSFSDGGDHASVPAATSSALAAIEAGASILDIGGMSTRPNAADVTPKEEASRVVPLVHALRSAPHNLSTPISVDTFRPDVARAAVEAGATIINDVYGGREPGMLQTMAELAVPVVLMHSRGTPATMTGLTDYSADGGVVEGVRREMEEMVVAALEAGVRRWNITLDPGIGFAKTAAQNFELLRRLPEVLGGSPLLRDFPVLVGLSRKRFLGPDKDAKDRAFETAAGVTASVASGWCEVVRVHDTKAMVDAVRVADAIYRR
ncbi:hypothetical protein JCM6882_003287 [Rhodosporidiobolus microsporus]